MITRKIIGWILSILFLFVIMQSQYILAASKIDDNFFKQNFNGSILVAKEGKILFRKGYGMADIEKHVPNTPSTILRIGSLTKQFTAMAILILEEQGKLSTKDPISKYIPSYPNGDKITLHNLLTHTSGIAEYLTPEVYQNPPNHYCSPENLISMFKNKPLNFPTGKSFRYSNSNYILLGYIIQKVSGVKYEDFVRKKNT